MHKKWIQKTSTSFLLLLFIFIHAVKTFHTHEYCYADSTNTVDKNVTIVKAVFACAICDFQIAKDSDAQSSIIAIATPVQFITSYYNFTLSWLPGFSVSSFGRGPPATIF